MTVKELKELLAEALDDMLVMVMVEDLTNPGMFAFAEACTCETGVGKIGIGDVEGQNVFLVLPHGVGVTEDELDNTEGIIPELN